MTLYKTLYKVDQLLCRYLGLETRAINLDSIRICDKQVFVTHTEAFKRHSYNQDWDNFTASNLKQTNAIDKEKLGIAAGKALAKNLVISFEEISINHSKKNLP